MDDYDVQIHQLFPFWSPEKLLVWVLSNLKDFLYRLDATLKYTKWNNNAGHVHGEGKGINIYTTL